MTTQLVRSVFVLCCVERVGYLMEGNMVYHFINGLVLQCIDFVEIFYFIIRKNILYTLFILLFYCKNVFFYLYLSCSVVFFSSFLNKKQIYIKIKIRAILSTHFFSNEIDSRLEDGGNQYQIQVVGECQFGDLPFKLREFHPG